MRPVLVVIGFIGGLLVFNAMVHYVSLTFYEGVESINGPEDASWLQRIFYTVAYVGMIYSLANASFKLIDLAPNWTMMWLGAQRDHNFEDSMLEGKMVAAANMASGLSGIAGAAAGGRDRISAGMKKGGPGNKAGVTEDM